MWARADCRFGVAVHRLCRGDRWRRAVRRNLLRWLQWSAETAIDPDRRSRWPALQAGKSIGCENIECVESRQITVQLLKPHDGTDIFLALRLRGGYGWLFPKGGEANVGLGVSPQFKHLLKPLLESLHARLVDRRPCRTRGQCALPVAQFRSADWSDRLGSLGATPVLLLCGDAAGLANPVTGAGISSAAMSGGLAGRAAAELLAGKPNAAENYEEELDDLFGPSLRRALRRRQLDGHICRGASRMRRCAAAWIAYPDYWAA